MPISQLEDGFGGELFDHVEARGVCRSGTVLSSRGREVLRTDWYVTAIPGLAILLSVLAISLVGEGLNDALNPRSNIR